ncbi:phosphoenolpyruvate synthase [Caerostris extrusa]|uniref:Phosphoenolpyruvate synthase n=1 Tax=Caerostris extrusa TaxID=172846 RepID=A0AAV4U9I6_CAEEX|nr:phosphoenolpyruvate synthase [Caerostris extrusa]
MGIGEIEERQVESLPGAISPLGLDILPKFWCIILRRDALEKGLGDHICKSKYFLTGFSAFYNRLMITVVEMINRYEFGTPNSKSLHDRHLLCTDNSSNWNMSMFDILVKEKGSFDNEVYTDFAKLLSTTTNVESANVPSSMQEVADQIVKDVSCEKFKSMTAKEALEWLKTTHLQSGHKFDNFLKDTGTDAFKNMILEQQHGKWILNH